MEKYDIGKSSLSEKKKKLLTAKYRKKSTEPSTEPKRVGVIEDGEMISVKNPITEPSTEPIKQTMEDHIKAWEKPTEPTTKLPNFYQISTELLSDFEFQIFKNASALIYRSNYKRYKNGRASGMLNALEIIKQTVIMIEKRIYEKT